MLLVSTYVALVYTRARRHEERSHRDLGNRLIESTSASANEPLTCVTCRLILRNRTERKSGTQFDLSRDRLPGITPPATVS